MTDIPVPEPHLNDEQLSASVDGHREERVDAHLRSCADCSNRLDAFEAVARWVATPVEPLDGALRDALVGTAVAEFDGPPRETVDLAARSGAPVVPLASRRRAGLSGLPALVAIAAALFLLVGIGSLVRSGQSASEKTLNAAGGTSSDEVSEDVAADASDASPATEGAAGSSADPETISAHLGDYDDPEALRSTLQASVSGLSARTAAASAEQTADASAAQSPTSASCTARAREVGAGSLGALLSISTLTWKGRPAEVLVFSLAEPAQGFTRQALVMARPGCALLADPRF